MERIPLGVVIGITYLGAFSRFTHGRYTPSFHAYQIDRAPDNESTRFIPFIDVTLATMLVVPQTRVVAAVAGTLFQGLGLVARVKSGKPLVWDLALASLTAFVAWSSIKAA